MTAPRQFLEEAGSMLARVEGLIGRAGEELGEPYREPLHYLAADAARLRRQLRNATTTVSTNAALGGES